MRIKIDMDVLNILWVYTIFFLFLNLKFHFFSHEKWMCPVNRVTDPEPGLLLYSHLIPDPEKYGTGSLESNISIKNYNFLSFSLLKKCNLATSCSCEIWSLSKNLYSTLKSVMWMWIRSDPYYFGLSDPDSEKSFKIMGKIDKNHIYNNFI